MFSGKMLKKLKIAAKAILGVRQKTKPDAKRELSIARQAIVLRTEHVHWERFQELFSAEQHTCFRTSRRHITYQ